MKAIAAKAGDSMNGLNLFGLFAVSLMVTCYALESRHHAFLLIFAISCVLASIYGFLQGAWPFGCVEAVWSVIAVRRWRAAGRTREEILPKADAIDREIP
jgi:hypothetical protein